MPSSRSRPGGAIARALPQGLRQRLTGRTVKRLWRRAKYLLAELDSGETLVIHLGMSGRIAVYADGKERKLGKFFYRPRRPMRQGKHDHVVMETDAPARIVFTDHRRFGLMTLIDTDKIDEDKLFKGLGVEPLSRISMPPIWPERSRAKRRRSSPRCSTSA